jgi:hypothetical protein
MKPSESELIDIADLRIGLYVELDLGWMSHPFPTGSFKISTVKQIEVIRGLGLKQVRWVPAKSDPPHDDSGDSRPVVARCRTKRPSRVRRRMSASCAASAPP